MTNVTPCAVCAEMDWHPVLLASDLHHRAVEGTFPLARCRACGHHALQPPLDAEALRAAYPSSYAPHQAPPRDGGRGIPRKWRSLSPTRGMKVLDVGCGGGRDLLRLQEKGCEVWGIEPDPGAASVARDLGLRIHTGTVHDAPHPPPLFDAISLVHVIEHVRDPVPTLRRAAEMLAPGGRLLVMTPNAGSWSFRLFRGAWYALDAPRHLNLFTPGSLAEACCRAGLAAVRIRTRSQPRVVRDSLKRTERRLMAAAVDTLPGRAALRIFTWSMAAVFGCGEELCVTATRP